MKINLNKINELKREILVSARRESKETKMALIILSKLLRQKEVSLDEKKLLREQSKDLVKIFPLILVSGIPIPIPITPILIALGEKYGFSFLPKSQEDIIDNINKKKVV